jgi:hypothetical protein
MQTLGRTRGPELRRPPGSLEVLVRLMRDSGVHGQGNPACGDICFAPAVSQSLFQVGLIRCLPVFLIGDVVPPGGVIVFPHCEVGHEVVR